MGDLTPEQKARIDALVQPKRTIEVVNLAGIEPRNAAFLWWPYLPLGSLVIVAGAPGNGKSQFAALIAAMASRGRLYPGSVDEPSSALMLCAEDDLATTVVPRLLAVNADIRLVETINVRTEYPDGLTSNGMISLPGDVGSIHAWVREHPDARLVVMDPVASFFGRSHSTLVNQDIRDVLGPLVAIAQMYGVTVVVVLHLNKSESRDFAAKIAESHGFQAMARSVLALGPDPDDKDGSRGSKKVLVVAKANLLKPGTYGMRCEVRSVTLPAYSPPIETSELVLTGKCDITADDLLMPSNERSVRIEAAEWLEQFLGDRWLKIGDVRKAAVSDGWSWRTIDRLAREKGYQRIKQTGVAHGPWWMGSPHARARDLHLATGNLENLESLDESNSHNPDTQGTQGTQESSYQGPPRARPREEDNGKLDDYRRLEQRKLGEKDDDE